MIEGQEITNLWWPSLPKGSFRAEKLFKTLVGLFTRLIDFEESHSYTLSAIYVVLTHLYKIFDKLPYLHLAGPRGSGKTTYADLMEGLCFQPFNTSDITEAALFRTIAFGQALGGITMIIDEADSLSNPKRQDILHRVLRSGYRSYGNVVRCAPGGGIVRYSTFCPKILLNEKGIQDPALESRTIVIHMAESIRPLEKLILSRTESEFRDLREMITAFSGDYRNILSDRYVSFKGVEGIRGRDEEVWTPILVTADLFADLLDAPSVKEDMLTLARKTILQRQKTQLVGNLDAQILVATLSYIKDAPPQMINGFHFFEGEALCDSIRKGWSIPDLRLETVCRVLHHFSIIKEVRRPRLKKTIEGSEIQVQRSCYLLDEEKLSNLTRQFFKEEGE